MRPWVIVLVIFLLIFLVAVVGVVGLFWMIGSPPSVASNSALELTVQGELPEVPSENPFQQILASDQMSLFQYWRMLDFAARDEKIGGVLLELGPLELSWAQIEELRDSLRRFRESGKPVHAFLAVDTVGEKELYLAAAADRIVINPDAALIINGLAAEVTFFKRTLDKLGVAPQFLQFKEFKSAEIYDRQSMSEPIREMLTGIIGDLEKRFVTAVAADRNTDEAKLLEILQAGMTTPEQAKEAGLIDEAGYRGDVVEGLRAAIDASNYRGIDASDYWKSAESRLEVSSGNRVALVTGVGIITADGGDGFDEGIAGAAFAERLREIRKNDRFKAVLLRVDSPGGSAVGSDMVWKEVRELEAAGKPVVVSMSGVAGSGGYYISMGAGRIVSQPSTITGSVGVIFGKFNVEGLFNWLGMDIDRIKTYPNADILSPFTSLDDNQKAQIRTWMEQIYNNFVTKAAEGRKTTFEEFEPKAHGRIYTGAQALEIGLIDDLGGYDVALARLREALDLADDAAIELERYPKPKTFWESLTEGKLVGTPQPSFQDWVARQLKQMRTVAPRVLMPEMDFR